MRSLLFDFETFNELDITSVGVSRYARDPSLEITLTSWSLDNAETIKQHDLYADGDRLPNEFLDALEDERVQKIAWNAPFEINVTREALKIDIPVETVTDPMVVARSLSMPGKLSEACRILNLPESEWKHDGGSSLISLFCKPRKPTPKNPSTRNTAFTHPEKWEKFRRYNVADIKAMAGCWFRMKRWNLSDEEWELWEYDRQINEAGVPVNLRAIYNANRIVDTLTAKSLDELTRITKLENANSGPQLLGWLKERDYPFNDLKVGHVKRALKEAIADGDGDTKYATALRRRTEISKASIKKFAAYDEMVNDDGLLRNMLQFNGAGRTCRWSGSGVQLHNMARPHGFFEQGEAQEALARAVARMSPREFAWVFDRNGVIDPFEALSSGVRGIIAAPEGYVFVSADFNAIENRVLGYMADEQKILDVFLNDRCPYIDFATYMFGGTYENLWHEYKVLKQKMKRQIAKPGVLGCGYMLGPGHEYEDPSTGEMLATGLLGYGRNMGIDLTPEQSAKSVEVWRATYSKVSDYDDGLWHNLDHAARKTIETGRRTSVNMIDFEKDGPFLTMRLPSGRKLYYIRPRIEERKMPWGDMRPSITYEGIDSRSQRKAWGRITTHPGKLCVREGSLVLTDRGPKPIESLSLRDRVWDGESWVSHAGLLDQGLRPASDFGPGIGLTPDHEVSVDGRWVMAQATSFEDAASSFARHFQRPGGVADCGTLSRRRRSGFYMGHSLRVWEVIWDGAVRVLQRASEIVRLSPGSANRQSEHYSRHVETPGVRGVEFNARAVLEPETPGLEELRRPRDHGLLAMANLVRKVLARHVRFLCTEVGVGSRRQRPRVFAGQLSVGHAQNKRPEQTNERFDRHARRAHDAGRSERTHGNWGDDAPVPKLSRVFDVADAGPNRRFTLVAEDGRMIVVHNCENLDQAIARDCLAHALFRLKRRNVEIIATRSNQPVVDVRMHVHDEIIALAREDDAERVGQVLSEAMSESPEWAPGLPLKAVAEISKVFVKT